MKKQAKKALKKTVKKFAKKHGKKHPKKAGKKFPLKHARALPPEASLSAAEDILRETTGIDFRIVSTGSIQPNAYNPNEMEDELFRSIVDQLTEEGGVSQTIMLRENPGEGKPFLLIDGEHRWRGACEAGIPYVLAAIIPTGDAMAKIKTLSMNNLRGRDISLKLAHVLVDLSREYSQEEIYRLTGIKESRQIDVTKLLDVPDLPEDETPKMNVPEEARPVAVDLLLMPDDYTAYEAAMTKAMGLQGAGITALLGEEVEDFHEAMGAASGLVGIKARNVALSFIVAAFNTIDESDLAELASDFAERTGEKSS